MVKVADKQRKRLQLAAVRGGRIKFSGTELNSSIEGSMQRSLSERRRKKTKREEQNWQRWDEKR